MDTEKRVIGSTHHDHGLDVEESDGVHHIGDNVFIKKAQTDHDDALDFLQASGDQAFTYTDKEATSVRWKIDLMLMPLVRITNTQGLGVDILTVGLVTWNIYTEFSGQGHSFQRISLWLEARHGKFFTLAVLE